uniref:Uncharacterized protein n=1 Tax=Ditylenchus dipsaci TaxID=166011 RepID=A0A915D4T7_9BILA
MEAAIAKILTDNAHSLVKTILKLIGDEGIDVSGTPKNEGKKAAQVTPDGMPKKRTVATLRGNKKKNKKRKRNNQAHINAGGKQ